MGFDPKAAESEAEALLLAVRQAALDDPAWDRLRSIAAREEYMIRAMSAAIASALREAYAAGVAAGLERAADEADEMKWSIGGYAIVDEAHPVAQRIRTLATEAKKGGGHE